MKDYIEGLLIYKIQIFNFLHLLHFFKTLERETKMREFIVENIKAAKDEMALAAQTKITQNNSEYIQNQLSGVLKKAEYKIKLQDEA